MNRRRLLIAAGSAAGVGGSYYLFFRDEDERLFGEETYPVTFEVYDEQWDLVEDSTIRVDGEPIDGMQTELTAGEHTITASADGYEDTETTIAVEENEDGETHELQLIPEYDDVEGEWEDSETKDPPKGDINLTTLHPRVTSYNYDEVTVQIPSGSLINTYRNGARIRIYSGSYDQPERHTIGVSDSFDYSDTGTTSKTISVDEHLVRDGVPVNYIAVIESTSGTTQHEYLCQTDPFELQNGSIQPTDEIQFDVESLNQNDREARYRRVNGEGEYYIQLRGVTRDTPWKIDTRVPKSFYHIASERARGNGSSSGKPEDIINNVFGPNATTIKHGFVQATSDVDLESGDELRFFADIVRSLPNSPEPVSGYEYPQQPIEETLVRGGGDIPDVAFLLGGLCYANGYPTGLLISGSYDHVAVGIADDSFDGYYVPYDDDRYYHLEPTRFNGGVGDAPEEVRTLTTSVRALEPTEE